MHVIKMKDLSAKYIGEGVVGIKELRKGLYAAFYFPKETVTEETYEGAGLLIENSSESAYRALVSVIDKLNGNKLKGLPEAIKELPKIFQ